MKRLSTHAKWTALLWLACAWAVLSLSGFVVSAATIRVPQDYGTVKDAYNAASSGDTILIQPSLYLEVPPALFGNGSKTVALALATPGSAIITADIPPPNDTWSGRASISGNSLTIHTDNYTASIAPEPGDPLPVKGLVPVFPDSFGRTLWFEWIAPTNGLTVINTFGSEIDTVLEVFKGMSYPPARLDSEIAWNNIWNEVGFYAQSGVAYQILVGGYNAAYGRISLNVTMTSPPNNDNFADALLLTGDLVQVDGTSISATYEPLEPDHANVSASNSVWFTWSVPSGESALSRPARISTRGSDFNTVVAVYQGNALGQLATVAAAGGSDLAFFPTAGATYHIALDGSTNSSLVRTRQGNYLLRLDYSVVDISVDQVSSTTNADFDVNFQAGLTITDWGYAPTGPLRLRLAARNGRDFTDIHRVPAASETNLAYYIYFAPNGLSLGGSTQLIVSGVCPAPITQGTGPNRIIRPWGVFAVLEERFASNWVTIDRAFLLNGSPGDAVFLTYGLGRSLPTMAPNETNQVLGVDVQISNYLTDGSSNSFYMVAQLDNGTNYLVSNATWSVASAWTMTTNGLLRIGQLAQTTSLSVTGRFNLGGVTQARINTIPVYKRPRLTLLPTATRNTFKYFIQGDFSAPYALQYNDDLNSTNWFTNSLGTLNLSPASPYSPTNDLMGTNLNRRFYRLNVWPRQ